VCYSREGPCRNLDKVTACPKFELSKFKTRTQTGTLPVFESNLLTAAALPPDRAVPSKGRFALRRLSW
jgi:hypothetical protein